MKAGMHLISTCLFVVLAVSLVSPMAHADSTQSNKNTWRNLGIAGAAVAGLGVLHHNSTETLLGAAGAAYSASRYEQERKSQDARVRWRRNHGYVYYHHRWHRRYR